MTAEILSQLERWYHHGEVGRIVYTCDKLLLQSDPSKLRPYLLFWKGQAHESAGRAWQGEAIYCYREGIHAAGPDRPIKVRLMASLGNIFSQTGDCSAYERLLPEFTRAARTKDPEVVQWSAFVWYNYGVTLNNAFRYAEAAQAYERAAQFAGKSGNRELLGRSLHNLGGVQLESGNLAQAAATMAEAESLLDDDRVGHKMVSRRAEYFLASGDLISAQQMITEALLHPLMDDFTRADVHYTWARTLAALRRFSEASEVALVALNYAVRAVHYPCVHRVNQFLQRIGSSPASA